MFSLRCATGGPLLVLLAALPLAAAPPRGYPAHPASVAPAHIEHKVMRGETMWGISQKHRTSVGAIMDYNHLPDHTVREGMILRIPQQVVEPEDRRRQHVHVVKSGEDFWSIAEDYEVSPALLAKANPNVNPNRVHEDMELIIPVAEEGDISTRVEPAKPAPQTGSMIQHTVGDDETFYSIGRRYGVPMEAVVAANPTVRPERLRAGMKVWVPGKNMPAPKTKPTEITARPRTRTHKVSEDESIASIAKKYGVTQAALLRENKLSEDEVIYVDDELKIPNGGTVATSPPPPQQGKTVPPKARPVTLDTPAKPSGNPASNTVGDDGTIRSYIVSAGEDENSICEAFGISKQQLYDHNRLAPTTRLKPGDEIAIPRVAKGRRR